MSVSVVVVVLVSLDASIVLIALTAPTALDVLTVLDVITAIVAGVNLSYGYLYNLLSLNIGMQGLYFLDNHIGQIKQHRMIVHK